MVYEFVWHFFSYFGDLRLWLGFFLVALVVYQIVSRKNKRKLLWIFFLLLPSILLSYSLVSALKNLFQVPRPCVGLEDCPSGYSFPSGHAGVAFAFALATSLKLRREKSYLFLVPLAILVSLSRVFLNYHTFIDILGGAAVGILTTFLFHEVYKSFKEV